MAFFNEMGQKLTQAGQDTANMAKSAASSAKLSFQISEQERVVNAVCAALGKAYLELCGNAPIPALAEQVQSAQAALQKLNELKAQSATQKQVRRCHACGAVVPPTASFCTTCGAALSGQQAQAQAQPGSNHCPSCGSFVAPGQHFCTTCGAPTAKNKPQSAPAPQPAPVSPLEVPPDTPDAKRCPVCGHTYAPSTQFCTNCGTKLEQSDRQQL